MRKFRKSQQFLRNISYIRLKLRPQLENEARYNDRKTWLSYIRTTVRELKVSPRSKAASSITFDDVPVQVFKKRFEETRTPVLIRESRWTQGRTKPHSIHFFVIVSQFLKLFQNELFECGEDNVNGFAIEVRLKDFLRYMRSNREQYPLYIFDSTVADWKRPPKKSNIIKKFFTPPRYFDTNFMCCLEEGQRPPWRWFLIGPKLSGTGLHVDPLGTSAWNRLLVGEKLWLLFPPDTPAELLKEEGQHFEEVSNWMVSVYSSTQCDSWPKEYKPLHIFQRPGEVVFVPAGWWHLVINLRMSIAVTQNFVSKGNFYLAWRRTIQERPDLAKLWIDALSRNSPTGLPLSP